MEARNVFYQPTRVIAAVSLNRQIVGKIICKRSREQLPLNKMLCIIVLVHVELISYDNEHLSSRLI